MKCATKSSKKTTAAGFSAEEKAAMKDRVREMKGGATEGEPVVLAKIAELREPDRALAQRLHALVRVHAPMLSPKTWYGMPAYARDGQVVCYFQSAQKFKTRYATLGFSDKANLDDGNFWPTAFALKDLGAVEEKKIVGLLKKANRAS